MKFTDYSSASNEYVTETREAYKVVKAVLNNSKHSHQRKYIQSIKYRRSKYHLGKLGNDIANPKSKIVFIMAVTCVRPVEHGDHDFERIVMDIIYDKEREEYYACGYNNRSGKWDFVNKPNFCIHTESKNLIETSIDYHLKIMQEEK